MTLFDDEIKLLAAPYANINDDILQNFWHLIFSDNHESYRNYIEDCFSLLGDDAKKKFRQKFLKDHIGFYEILNELIIGRILADHGWQLQYEPRLDGQTPDWLITNNQGEKVILDVFTSRTPVYMGKQFVLIEMLDRLFLETNHNAIIHVEIKDFFRAKEQISEFASEIQKWLNSSPQINDVCTFKEFTATLLHINREAALPRIYLLVPTNTSKRNDLRDLPDKIIDKANKYEKISRERNIPFAVAIAFDRMLIDEHTAQGIICTSGYSYLETHHSVDESGDYTKKNFVPNGRGGLMELEERYDEGVFRKDYLSGVITFWFHSRQFTRPIVFRNPKAAIPLSNNLFPDSDYEDKQYI